LKSGNLTKYYEILKDTGGQAPSQAIDSLQTPQSKDRLEIDLTQFQFRGSPDFAVFVPTFNCAACLWLVDHALKHLPGLKSFHVNLEERILIFKSIPGDEKKLIPLLINRLSTVGYKAFPLNQELQNLESIKLDKRRLIHIGVSAAVFGNVMLFSSSVYLAQYHEAAANMSTFFNWCAAALSSISILYCAQDLFYNSYHSIRNRTLHIDLPIVVALVVAWALSMFHLFSSGGDVYFDSVSGLVFFLLLSRYLSESLAAQARRFVSATARTIPLSGKSLAIGDQCFVEHGAIVPADGVLISNDGEFSETPFTGESLTTLKHKGDTVFGGALNMGPTIKLEVRSTGDNTRLKQIQRLIEDATTQRSSRDLLAAKVARWFVFSTFVFCALAILIWWPSGFNSTFAVVCAVLIVSCPCALGMAIPLANSLAIKGCWKESVIVRNVDIFAKTVDIDTVIFDKTGTLTQGKLWVVDNLYCQNAEQIPWGILQNALTVSQHPVSKAIYHWANQFETTPFEVLSCELAAGKGTRIVGSTRDLQAWEIMAGSCNWIREATKNPLIHDFLNNTERQHSDCQLAVVLIRHLNSQSNESCVALILEDKLRHDALETLSGLRTSGLKVLMLTGDRAGPSLKLAKTLHFSSSDVLFEHSPEAKINAVSDLLHQGRKVMMIGDGVNDAAVLKKSTVGIGVHGSSDVTNINADAFLTSQGLNAVHGLISFSKYHQNSLILILGVSASYNLVAIALALVGKIHPLTAALIMPSASLTVVLITWLRKGTKVWKSSTLSCPLP
jgi:Cu2+-exporting ATPase